MAKKKKKSEHDAARQYLFEEIIQILQKAPSKLFNYKQVAAALGSKDNFQKGIIEDLLRDLAKKEIIVEVDRGRYKAKAMAGHYAIGKVDMTSTGAAYIVCEGETEDVFVQARKLQNAFHGDTVKVYLYPRKKGLRPEGEVTEVLQRAKTEFVGVLQVTGRNAFLVPDNTKMLSDIFIPLENLKGGRNGEKAIAKIIEWPTKYQNPVGEIVEVLGMPGENDTEMHAILAEFGLPYDFPKEVERMADYIPTRITEEEIAKRRDFREITTFTIDPFDAKDFDDALSIRKLENGHWEVGVHIADVTHYVKTGTIIDKEALDRATSVYLVDRVVPMLPEALSNNLCSLRPQEEKLCFSAVFELNEQAHIMHEWIGRTIIFSDRRFTYEEAQQILETGEGDYAEELLTLDKLAKELRKERFKKGSIGFDKQEVKFKLDEEGNPIGVFFKEQKDSNKLIEDFMLLANRKVAEFVGKKDRKSKSTKKDEEEAEEEKEKQSSHPFVYRVHDQPNEDKLAQFSEFAGKFGFKILTKSKKAIADSMNKMLGDIAGKPQANMLETLAIRTMAKAIYTTHNIGHYGLGFDHYTHFTSPIRRYPDMMVHRLLEYYLQHEEKIREGKSQGGKGKREERVLLDQDALEDQCKHSSDREKMAAEAERASIKYKQVQYMSDKIGHDFDGFISGVTEWGLFIELAESKCEGMVRIKEMRDDQYIFDEDNYCLKGKRNKKIYTLGDKVKVMVKRADLAKKQLDFVLTFDY